MSRTLAVLLIAVTYAAEIALRLWHLAPRSRSVLT